MANDFTYDPASAQMYVSSLNNIKKIQEEVFKTFSENTKDISSNLETFLDVLKKSNLEGTNLQEVFDRLSLVNEKMNGSMNSYLSYVKKAVDEGENLENIMHATSNVAKELGTYTDSWSRQLRDIDGLLGKSRGSLGEIGGAMVDLTRSTIHFGQALSSAEPGWLKILGILMDVALTVDRMSKYTAEFNRVAYDASAAMGSLGTKSNETLTTISSIVGKYKMKEEIAAKLVGSLSNIGAKTGEIANIADKVAARYTLWSELTPEYQTKMMSDYMKQFGVNVSEADKLFGNLLSTATSLKHTVSALDMKEFMSQTHQIAVNTAQWGYDLGDSSTVMRGIVTNMKELTGGVDLIRAAEISQSMMTYGLQNAAWMSYMATQHGTTAILRDAPLPEQIGRIAFHGEKGGLSDTDLGKMQLSLLQEMVGLTTGDSKSKEALAGGLIIAQEQGVIPKMSMEATKRVAELMAAAKFDEAYRLQTQSAKDLKDSGINTAKNTEIIAQVVWDTKSYSEILARTVSSWYLSWLGTSYTQEDKAMVLGEASAGMLLLDLMEGNKIKEFGEIVSEMKGIEAGVGGITPSEVGSYQEAQRQLHKKVAEMGLGGYSELEQEIIDRTIAGRGGRLSIKVIADYKEAAKKPRKASTPMGTP